MGEVSDRTRARVMADGELMATRARRARILRAQGINVDVGGCAHDAEGGRARGASAKASVLVGDVRLRAGWRALAAQLATLAPVVITQGFIASDDEGNTVLLGRGGSDTSAAYLAAKCPRAAPGDLDRRARHVQRESALHAHGAPAARAALR